VNEEHRRGDSFVLRIWWEEEETSWRGWIQHAATGDSRYFNRLVQLLTFVEAHIESPSEPRPLTQDGTVPR